MFQKLQITKVFFSLVLSILLFLIFFSKANAQSINVTPSRANCDNQPVTFTASGLDINYQYDVTLMPPPGGSPDPSSIIYTSSGGETNFTFTIDFNIVESSCPPPNDRDISAGYYVVDIWEGGILGRRGGSDNIEFVAGPLSQCQLIPNYPFYPYYPTTIVLQWAQPSTDYTIEITPHGYCTLNGNDDIVTVTTDVDGRVTVDAVCEHQGFYQAIATGPGITDPDTCQASFFVVEQQCTGQSGSHSLGFCYPYPTPGCPPGQEPDGYGQPYCPDGFACCVNPIAVPPPTSTPTVSPTPEHSYSQLSISGLYGSVFPTPGDITFNTSLTPGTIVSALLNYIFPLAGLLLLLYLIYGGFVFLTSAGDPKKAGSAKKIITHAFVGFIVVFIAFWITQIVARILGTPEIDITNTGT